MLEGQIKCSDHITCDTQVVVRSMGKTEGFFFVFFFGSSSSDWSAFFGQVLISLTLEKS